MARASFAIAPLLLMLGTQSLAQPASWRVSEVTGAVTIAQGGQSRPATRGALLASGATITTDARARAVLVRGQEFVVVSPRSRLRIPEVAEARSGIIQMLSDWGTALFRIERRETPHFGVQTPYLAAVVKGTTFTVTVGEAGASVQVTEGAVEVSTNDGGAMELVRPGMIASVGAADLQLLNIDGETSRSIRSQGSSSTGAAQPAPAAWAGPPEEPGTVTITVSEEPVSLRDVTDGLLEGSNAVQLALNDVTDAARTLARDPGNVEEPGPAGPGPGPGDPPAGGSAGGDSQGGNSGAGGGSNDAGGGEPGSGGDGPPAGSGDGDGGSSGAGDGSGNPGENGSGTGGPGTGSGTPGDDSGSSDDDGNNGHGNDDDGNDSGNPGNGGGAGGDDDDISQPGTGAPGGNDGGSSGGSGTGGGDDDGNNGHGNDDDGGDSGNPGNGGGQSGDDDGNNGHGNDDDGDDSGNPGNGGGQSGGDDGNNGNGSDDDGDDSSNPGNEGNGNGNGNGSGGDDGDISQPGTGPVGGGDAGPGNGGIDICLPGDLLCIGIGGDDREENGGPGRGCLGPLCIGVSQPARDD